MTTRRVSVRNATFQHWETLLRNRTKRTRAGELLVQGVRPVRLALDAGVEVRAVLTAAGGRLSDWARETARLARERGAQEYVVDAGLLAELGEKDDAATPPELLLVAAIPADDLGRIAAGPDLLAVVLDRPTSPGNVGSVIRSVDAFGGSGVVVTGHAADPWDPRAVRASTGSVFTVPTVRAASTAAVVERVRELRAAGLDVQLVGTDERGELPVTEVDLTRPTVLVTGNETSGMSAAWWEACDLVTRIPIRGAASSLNMANATTVLLYEADRQRAAATSGGRSAGERG